MDHVEKAYELFKAGCNCSQSVCGAFSDLLGIDEETLLRLSSSFGGGFGRLRGLCGAVAGMGLVAGYLYGDKVATDRKAKAEHYARVQELAHTFQEEHGSIICMELLQKRKLQVNTDPVPDERNSRYYQMRPCVRLVESAAKILDQYIKEHPVEIADHEKDD